MRPRTPKQMLVRLSCAAFWVFGSSSSVDAQALTVITGYPGATWNIVTSVSHRGDAATGYFDQANEGFMWRHGTGYEFLPRLSGLSPVPLSFSRNGRYLVGYSWIPGGLQLATRWDLQSRVAERLHGSMVSATACSADGRSVVGFKEDNVPVRWENSAIETLTAPFSTDFPSGVSDDGSVIVGRNFCWTRTGGVRALPGSNQGFGWVYAKAVSSDGSRAFALASPTGSRLCQLISIDTTTGEPTILGSNLGLIFGVNAQAIFTASADGSVIVGHVSTQLRSFVYTPDWGLLTGPEFLARVGLDMSEWTNFRFNGVSGDGRVIFGFGNRAANPGVVESFLITIPAPPAGAALTLAGILASRRRR